MNRRDWGALGADVVCVLVFAAVGRRSHEEAAPIVGIAYTAWPFLLGLLVGWFVLRRTGRDTYGLGVVPPLVLHAVAIGMIGRLLTGRGVQLSFVLVATAVLTAFLLAWRFVAQQVLARRTDSPA